MLDTVVDDNRWIHAMVLFKGLLKKKQVYGSPMISEGKENGVN